MQIIVTANARNKKHILLLKILFFIAPSYMRRPSSCKLTITIILLYQKIGQAQKSQHAVLLVFEIILKNQTPFDMICKTQLQSELLNINNVYTFFNHLDCHTESHLPLYHQMPQIHTHLTSTDSELIDLLH